MKETQLNLLRITFGILSILLYLKAATTSALTAAEWRQRTPAQMFAAQPRGNAPQYHQRRQQQPFNALLAPTDHLAEAAYRHNDEHSALTKTLSNTQTRFVRAADNEDEGVNDDGDYGEDMQPWSRNGDEVESAAASEWLSENFGQMLQTLAEWMGLVINAIWKLFTSDDGNAYENDSM